LDEKGTYVTIDSNFGKLLCLKNLESFGAFCELQPVGDQELPDGTFIPYPPVLFGHLGNDPKKKTICIYGHLDVQPALKVSLKHTTVDLSLLCYA